MKVLVFVDHDIICRHFLMNGALRPLTEAAEVLFVFPDDGNRRVTLDPDTLDLGSRYTRVPIDAFRQQAWRWLLYADQLRFRRGTHEAAIRRIRCSVLGWKAALLLTLGGLPIGSAILQAVVAERIRQHPARELEELFDREQPDVVLHPSVLDGVFINDLVKICDARDLPLVVAMNSWDNPATKRAVVGRPRRLLVWGPQTQDHAVRFIGLPRETVVPFGAAQFDVYRDPPRTSRARFAADHDIDPALPIMLFAGSNAGIDEFATLEAIDAAIGSGALPPFTVIYRPHPWAGAGAGGHRFGTAAFHHIAIDRTMRTYVEQVAAGNRKMSLPDYRDTHDLLSSVDMVVSPGSTILIEAALHAKPVIAFLPENDEGRLADIVPLIHFEEFFALEDIAVARTREALFAQLRVLSDNAERHARGHRLQGSVTRFLTPFDRPWRERIVEFLTELIARDGMAYEHGE